MALIATAYFRHCTQILESVAKVLQRESDRKKYQEQYQAIRNAFSKAFFDHQGKCTIEL